MNRRQNAHQGISVFGGEIADPCPARERQRYRNRKPEDVDTAPLFKLLPDELVLFLFGLLDDPVALVSIAQTCRRHHALANDPTLWRSLCESRFGTVLLHREFAAHGKCWSWLYRAQARAAALTGDDVGAVIVRTHNNDHIYWGDCRDGRPHGYGLMLLLPTRHCLCTSSLVRVWAASTATTVPIDSGYDGEWRDGRMCGRGTFTFQNGARHRGELRDDVRNGSGEYVRADGFKCDGTWKDDRHTGPGTATWPDGEYFVGAWADDMRNGYGVCTYPDGAHYEGEWKNDEPNGYGVRTWPDGDRYEGQWQNGTLNGHGVYTWSDGSRYEGQFANDESHGYGAWTNATGDRYVGHWKNDRYHGHGVATCADGTRYIGNYIDDVRSGEGLLIKPTGARYQGQWLDNQRHGRGVQIKADGSRYKGQWQHGRKDGDGAWEYPDGSSIQGEWAHDNLIRGHVVRHRAGSPSCCLDSPCRACAIVGALRVDGI